jgi:hypothetical protein
MAPFFLFPKVCAVHWLDIYPGAQYPNTTCSALLLSLICVALVALLCLALWCVCFREKHAASDFENTNIEDYVVRNVRKEEIPICFDFRVAGVGNDLLLRFICFVVMWRFWGGEGV